MVHFFPQFFLLTTQLLYSQETQLSDLGSGVLLGKDTQLRTQASCVSQHPGKLKDTIFFFFHHSMESLPFHLFPREIPYFPNEQEKCNGDGGTWTACQ